MSQINFVGLLNEFCQKHGLPLPEYSIVSKIGPSHSPTITVSLTVNNETFMESALKKKTAEQKCAEKAVKLFNIIPFLKSTEDDFKYKVVDHECNIEELWEGNEDTFVIVLKRYNVHEQEHKRIKVTVVENDIQ